MPHDGQWCAGYVLNCIYPYLLHRSPSSKKIRRWAFYLPPILVGRHPLHFINLFSILRQLEEASKCQSIYTTPNVPIAQNNLAWIYAEAEENLDEAVQLAEAANKLVPGNFQILDTLGWVYYKKGDYQKAVESISEAIKVVDKAEAENPAVTKDPSMYYHLGLAYNGTGNTSKAQEAFKQVLTLNPNFEKADEIRTMLK